MDDDFVTPPKPGKREAEASAGTSAAEGSGGKKPKKNRKDVNRDTSCFVLTCDEQKRPGKKWCLNHNIAFDSMSYQARQAVPPEMDTLNQIMSTPEYATQAMEDWCRNNPGDAKYVRKTMINWGQWKRRFITERSSTSRDGCQPFEERQWLNHGKNIMGWSDEETKAEWARHKRTCEQDNSGIKGCLRLWIPVIEARFRDKTRKEETSFDEGGQVEKNLSQQQRAALIRNVIGASSSSSHTESDAFLRGASDVFSARQTETKKEVKEEDGDDDDDVGDVNPGDNQPVEKSVPKETVKQKRARVRLEKLSQPANFATFRASILQSCKQVLEKEKKLLDELPTSIEQAKVAIATQREQEDDECFATYLQSLEAVLEYAACWQKEAATPDDLQNVFTKHKNVFLPLQSASALKTKTAFANLMTQMEAVKVPQELEVQSSTWKSHVSALNSFTKNCGQVAVDAKKFVQQKEKRRAKADQHAQKEKEKAAERAAKEKAKAAVEATSVKGKSKCDPLWSVGVDLWTPVVEKQSGFDVDTALDAPWVLRNPEAVQKWKAIDVASVQLNQFASTYKKLDGYDKEDRVQSPIVAKKGLEEFNKLIAKVFPSKCILDISSVPSGSNFMANAWYYGTAPTFSKVLLLASTAAQVRVQAMGEVRCIVFLMTSVLEAMGAAAATATLDDVIAFCSGLTAEKKDFKKAKGWHAHLRPGDVAFFPQGSILCEKSTSGALFYGVRKSFVINHPAAAEQYRAAVGVLKRSNRDASRMESIAALFK